MSNLILNLEPVIKQEVDKALKALDLEGIVKQGSKSITVTNGEKVIPMGIQHKQFESILKLINIGENLMIKGDAGN